MGSNRLEAFSDGVLAIIITIIRSQGPDSALARAVGDDWKGKRSPALYALAIPAAFVHPGIAGALYAAVALVWLVHDQRIEKVLAAHRDSLNATAR